MIREIVKSKKMNYKKIQLLAAGLDDITTLFQQSNSN